MELPTLVIARSRRLRGNPGVSRAAALDWLAKASFASATLAMTNEGGAL